MTAGERRWRQTAWLITGTLTVGCILNAITHSAAISTVAVLLALAEAQLPRRRARLAREAAARRSGAHERMGQPL
ncbi:MAG: hypothetical protein KGH75_00345 [Rhodospirillales bacterium]|nr:hypothetical protein [Rhodospirillales bacterium]